MSSNFERDYISKHTQIKKKLLELTSNNERACVDVAQLASQLGMDKRTVRSHLKIMEVDVDYTTIINFAFCNIRFYSK